MMKAKHVIPAGIALVFSLILAIGSRTFLAPCIHDDGSVAACAGAGRMLLAVGCVMSVLSVAVLTARKQAVRRVLNLVMGVSALLGFLTPGVIMPLCRMSSMRCRAVTQPAGMLLSALVLLCAVSGIILDCMKSRERR